MLQPNGTVNVQHSRVGIKRQALKLEFKLLQRPTTMCTLPVIVVSISVGVFNVVPPFRSEHQRVLHLQQPQLQRLLVCKVRFRKCKTPDIPPQVPYMMLHRRRLVVCMCACVHVCVHV